MQAINERTKYDNIPNEMKQVERWILWSKKAVKDKEGNIKYTKIPKDANGYPTDVKNASNYLAFNDAVLAYHTGDYDGIGFCLVEDDPYIIIDIDDCFKDGKLSGKAKKIVDSLDSFTEISQSGNGLHIVMKGDNIRGFNNQKEGVEMYSQERFFAMTGDLLSDNLTEIQENNPAVQFLHDRYKTKEAAGNAEPVKDSPQVHDDARLLEKARNAKNKDKFIALYDKGDMHTYHNGDDSGADMGLANELAWWTKNAAQIERLMRGSALYRPEKWDRRESPPGYLKNTIYEALRKVQGGYGVDDGFKLQVEEEKKIPEVVLNKEGNIRKLLTNLKELILFDPKIKGIGFNEFTQEITIDGEAITDNFISNIRYSIDSKHYVTFTKDDVMDMLGIVARERNTYHPIKLMIESAPWDGQKRAESIFIDYLGADDNDYTRSITKKWLAGAVARIYEPGIKMEIVPVLQGDQGIGKSTISAKLGKEAFLDSLFSLGNTKDDYQLLIGSWIVELSELSSMGSTQVERMKGFVSAQSDKIRLPYGKVTQDYKRTCVFIGTTNNTQFLNDLTGNRRFFPIPLGDNPTLDIFSLDDDTIQQIWAEAYQLYKNGEKLFLNKDDEEVAEIYRDAAMEENLFYQEIEDYLNMRVPENWNNLAPHEKKAHYGNYRHLGKQGGSEYVDRTTGKEIAYVLDIDSTNRAAQSQMKKINLYMDNLDGWEKKSVYIKGETKQGFKKKV